MKETKEERERRLGELRLGIVGDERLAHIAERPEAACDQDVEVIARELLSVRRLLRVVQ